jgi:hypothetical protein
LTLLLLDIFILRSFLLLVLLPDLSFVSILSPFVQNFFNSFPGCDAANDALYLYSGGNKLLLSRESIGVAYCWRFILSSSYHADVFFHLAGGPWAWSIDSESAVG